MNTRTHMQPYLSNSLAIRQEIQRFESVHPSIYAIYDLIELIPDPLLAQQIREHVVCIEDSFVNSQEWTLSRTVPDIKLGIVGSLSSGKSALVHRYLTGSYMQEESPEGGRFKKEIVIEGQSYLLLIRDEGGPPELQFTSWVDAVIFVFSLENEASFNAVYNYYAKMAHYRNTAEVPLILVGTQDAISESNPRVIDDSRARKMASDLKRCSYYETCATYGLNVERVFQDACQKIVQQRMSALTPTNSGPSTPNHSLRYYIPSPTNNGFSSHSNQSSNASTSPSSNLITASPSHSTLNIVPGSIPTQDFKDNKLDKNILEPPKDQKELTTPSSTPTTSRKSRRRSNLFTPKKGDEDKKSKNGEMGSGRVIPIKQGHLYKRSSKSLNKEWKKKYVTLCDDGRLTYHPSLHDYMDDVHGKEISLVHTTVKVPGQRPRGTRTNPSASGLTSGINNLSLGDSDGYEFIIVSLDNKQWHFDAANLEERDAWVAAVEQQILACLQGNESSKSKSRMNSLVDAAAIQAIRSVRGNNYCVDCEAANPDWSSINLGALMCIECSGIHRNLGSHISRVRSLDLDEWPSENISVMMALGNHLVNSIWESNLHGRAKPTPNSSREEKERWIRAKYELKEFIAPLPTHNLTISQQLIDAVCKSDLRMVVLLLAYATAEQVNSSVSSRDQRTSLHLACTLGNSVITQLLIWYNANVKLVDQEGRTALVYARNVGSRECIDILLHNGCPDTSSVSGTLPRRKGSISRKNPEVFDKLPASVI